MDMLTNYKYTIDYTNDADGAAETWGVEGGHGIISASQMLAWVEANCSESCPGEPAVVGCFIDDQGQLLNGLDAIDGRVGFIRAICIRRRHRTTLPYLTEQCVC